LKDHILELEGHILEVEGLFMDEEKIRAFFAVEIPNEATISAIMQYQKELQQCAGSLKLVERPLLHLTLRFLGDIDLPTAKTLYSFIQTDLHPMFFSDGPKKGIIRGVGDFKMRTFYINVEKVAELLTLLNTVIEKKLTEFPRIKSEDKAFTPHITIARAKDSSHASGGSKYAGPMAYQALKNKYQHFEFGPWRIDGVVLRKSVLTPTGPIYTNLTF
jgi:RNA 2',3'-cyclic 3'-phosphodiesterase